jgi:hypothetical protein
LFDVSTALAHDRTGPEDLTNTKEMAQLFGQASPVVDKALCLIGMAEQPSDPSGIAVANHAGVFAIPFDKVMMRPDIIERRAAFDVGLCGGDVAPEGVCLALNIVRF